jgi:hypothetical protein
MTEEAFAREHLFEPLGITDLWWQTDPQGYTRGWADLYLRPLDAAKLGGLWLRGGEWDGRQLVSRAWIEESVTAHIRANADEDYGYGWWLPRDSQSGEYRGVGRGGQHLAVHPAFDLVVVLTAGGIEADWVNELLAPALVAPGGSLPPRSGRRGRAGGGRGRCGTGPRSTAGAAAAGGDDGDLGCHLGLRAEREGGPCARPRRPAGGSRHAGTGDAALPDGCPVTGWPTRRCCP